MTFIPLSKNLLVEKIEEALSNLIPEELRPKRAFTICRVVDIAFDCQITCQLGDLIVVRTEGLEEINFREETYIIVSEKFIVGEIDQSDTIESEPDVRIENAQVIRKRPI